MKWTAIIVVLLLAWQVIGAIIEQAAKKKQAERLKAQAQRQQDTARSGEMPPPPAQPSRPGGMTAQQRIEAIAERRKKQLEELQRRRQARKAGPAGLDVSTQSAPTPTTVRSPVSSIPNLDVGIAPGGRERMGPQGTTDQTQQAKAPDTTRAPRQRRASRPEPVPVPKQPTAPKIKDPRSRVKVAAERDVEHAEASKAAVFRERLGSPESLRQVMILKELLDPPVSLRPPAQGG